MLDWKRVQTTIGCSVEYYELWDESFKVGNLDIIPASRMSDKHISVLHYIETLGFVSGTADCEAS